MVRLIEYGYRYPPLEPFTHYEHGKDADPSFQNLFDGATSVQDITPNIGAEVQGVQISKLGNAGKDQLALFTAQKKVVGEWAPDYLRSDRQVMKPL